MKAPPGKAAGGDNAARSDRSAAQGALIAAENSRAAAALAMPDELRGSILAGRIDGERDLDADALAVLDGLYLAILAGRGPRRAARAEELVRISARLAANAAPVLSRPGYPTLRGQRREVVIDGTAETLGQVFGLTRSAMQRRLDALVAEAVFRPLRRGAQLPDGKIWLSRFEVATNPVMVARWKVWRARYPRAWDLRRPVTTRQRARWALWASDEPSIQSAREVSRANAGIQSARKVARAPPAGNVDTCAQCRYSICPQSLGETGIQPARERFRADCALVGKGGGL